MKKTLLLLTLPLFFCMDGFSQTRYATSFHPNAGHPGSVNTDTLDNQTAGWSILLNGSLATNQWSGDSTIPFVFNYFGNPVNTFRVSANGLVSFAANPSLPDNNTDLPSAILPDSTIACFWDAFTNTPPTASNDIVYWTVWGTAPNRQLWIKWSSFEVGAPSANNATFYCVLEETTNNIYLVEGTFSVNIATPLASVTTGLQLDAATASQYDNMYRTRPANANAIADNNYITFSPYVAIGMSIASASCTHPTFVNAPKNSVNNVILRVNVNTLGELNPLAISQLSFNTNGTSNTSDLSAAMVYYTGSDSTFNTSTPFGTAINNPSGLFDAVGSQTLGKGDNYFWLTYNITAFPSLGFMDAECTNILSGVTPVPVTNPSPSGYRLIGNGLSGSVFVGSGGTYQLLSEAFKAINEEGLSDDLTLIITSDIADTGKAVLTVSNESNFSIHIIPADTVVKNIVARQPGTYIDFQGSKRVVINGSDPLAPAGKHLRFRNESDSGAVFRFSNGSQNDSIQYCIIEGACVEQTNGLVHLASSIGLTGNHHIVISNNEIRDRSDSTFIPAILVYSQGSELAKNHDITIQNNHFFNYMRSAVYVEPIGNGGNWKVNGNSFFYNAPVEPLAGDLVSIMLIGGPFSDYNEVHDNYFGGSAPLCGGSAWVNNRAVNFVCMNINTGVAVGTSIQGNTFQNMVTTSAANLAWIAIRLESGRAEVGNITGNLIGHPTLPNSITSNLYLTFCIYGFAQGNSEVIVANNLIANINATTTANLAGFRGISFQAGAASPYIVNNVIRDITCSATISSTTTTAISGIAVVSGTNLGTIYVGGNKVYNLTSTALSATVTPTGIAIDNQSADGIIENNIVYNIFGTSTAGSIHGLHIAGPANNWMVRNNMISLTNGNNTAPMAVRGISDFASGNVVTYINNSVYIGGTASGTAASFAFERRNVNSTPTVFNNIFYNERTGGTGVHAAIGNTVAATNWTASTSHHNLLVSAAPNTIGAWTSATASQSFGQWQISSPGDQASWSDTAANVPSALFFKDVTTGDLSIDSSANLCWYVNGKGIATALNSTDKDGQNRSVLINTGATDIGSDEFQTTTLPVNATESGNVATGDSTTFTFAGRKVLTLYWTGNTPPASFACKPYTGEFPDITGQTGATFNSYIDFTSTTFPAPVDVKQYYDSAHFGTVSNTSNIITLHYNAGAWQPTPALINPAEHSFRSSAIQGFSRLSGSDATNPVPVKLLTFNGKVIGADVQLDWHTASEKNADRFEIEAGITRTAFEKAGTVYAKGNSVALTSYTFTDPGAFKRYHTSLIYYRLKMVDQNGTYQYSDVIPVSITENTTMQAALYPNPFTPETRVEITSMNEGSAAVLVYDLHGKLLSTETVALAKGNNRFIPASVLSAQPGMYFITVTIGEESQTFKLMK